MPLVVITGVSGSGKSLAASCFEDLDFFCVDNLPVSLIPSFCELIKRGTEQLERAALVVDAREREFLTRAPEILRELRRQEFPMELLFFDCSDDVLKRRYKETRRPHPLATEQATLDEALAAERKALEPIRQLSDRIIDTSHYTSHQLRAYLKKAYGQGEAQALSLHLMSFGFKYGVPSEADLIFDVRFLPNPYFIDDLRPLDGRTAEVQKFLDDKPDFHEFNRRLEELLTFLLPLYEREGKAYLTVAVGCTGGKHRSVGTIERLAKALEGRDIEFRSSHRDLGRE